MKKKGMALLILGLLACLTSAFFLTGCKHEHEYTEQTVAANCGVAGSKIYTCEECGDTYTEEIPATGMHRYKPQLYANDTNHWHFCEVCYQNVEETAHVWNDGVITVAATFETTGIKTYKCTICDKEKQEEIPVIPHTHEWDQGVITLPATTTTTGIKTYSCMTCDKEKQEEVPVIPHTHTYSADWLSDGTHHWKSCSICFDEQEKQEHEWNQGVVTNPATTTAAGDKTYTCITCDKKKVETIPMLPHEHNFALVWSGDEADHWHACTLCDDVKDKGAHVWNEGLIALPATTTSTGVKQYSCSICQKVRTEEIPMLPATNSPLYALVSDIGSYMVTGFDGMAAEITIPATYNGLRVIGIAEKAFYKNPYVKKITLPNTIERIDESAFEDCTSLTSINIPESVTSIGWKAFKGCTALTSVLFDAEIEGVATSALTIEKEAFKGCINLASLTLAENTKTIGEQAFENCFSLQTVNFNARLLYIGDNAFANCRVLDGVVFNQALQTIGRLAFDNCIALTKIVLPDSVLSVGAGAFRCAEKLQEVTLSENMTAIANATFQSCKVLGEIVIPENIEAIGISAFSGCESLQDVSIMGDISLFGDQAFYGCEKLETLYFNSSTVATLYNEHYIFYNAGIKGRGITLTIGANAFVPHGLFEAIHNENVPNLTKIIIEDGATEIEYFTVYNYLPYVTEIVIPDSVTHILSPAFRGCPDSLFTLYKGGYYLPTESNPYAFFLGMKEAAPAPVEEGQEVAMVEVEIHEDTHLIACGALSGWYNVSSLTLPFAGAREDGLGSTHFGYIFGAINYLANGDFVPSLLSQVTVTSGECISEYAFYNCSSLTSVVIPDSVTSIGEYAFRYCSSLTEMTLPFVGASESATGYQAVLGYIFGYITRSSSSAISGATYQYYDGTYYHYYIPNSLREITITDGDIASYAFYNSSSLTSVTIGNSVMSIGNSAFYNCYALTSVDIGDNVTSIGSDAFYNCSSLTSVVIPGSVTSIGSYAFRYCSSLTDVVIPDSVTSIGDYAFSSCSGLTSVVIPDSVETIGSCAFSSCTSLTSVTIGNSVTSIGSEAFFSCSSLTSVYIPNSVTRIGSYAFYGCSSLTSLSFGYAYYNTWYRTSYSSYQYGTSMSLTNSSTNASYFTSNYYSYYWYKL